MESQKMQNTFSKEERLCSNKRIDALFASGDSFIAYPLRVVYISSETESPQVSILVSVSKKKFKRAVKRNRVKRLIREAYRLNKSEFLALSTSVGYSFDIAFLYLKNELPTYQEIENAILKSAKILNDKVLNKEEKN